MHCNLSSDILNPLDKYIIPDYSAYEKQFISVRDWYVEPAYIKIFNQTFY